jgi:hypothetical protein
VRRGLEQTRGSYPLVASLFNLPDEDYRKLMRFLHKYDCHLPIQRFRTLPDAARPVRDGAAGVGGYGGAESRRGGDAVI